MPLSILHISDLHRDLTHELHNDCLLESIGCDVDAAQAQEPPIPRPSLCIVSGDLIYGVTRDHPTGRDELERQYKQAEEFLVRLAERLFNGDRRRIVLLPGNHDVSAPDVFDSLEKVPSDGTTTPKLVAELFNPNSTLRWSWKDLSFYRVKEPNLYNARFRYFSKFYTDFYGAPASYSANSEEQWNVVDFPEFKVSIVCFNSCHNNDPLRRMAAIDPRAVAAATRALRDPVRSGHLIAAAWHHSTQGGPSQDDYLDSQVLQPLIDAGVSLAFHGHQHTADCVDERFRLGPKPRKLTLISAGTLCAGPRDLVPGVARSFNLVELDPDHLRGRLHKRTMVNQSMDYPMWGPGYVSATGTSYIDFDLSPPLHSRPRNLDSQLLLERADILVGHHRWAEALAVLHPVRELPAARPLLVQAVAELDDPRMTISMLWPPQTSAEAVVFGGAVLEAGTRDEATLFAECEIVATSRDASVLEVLRRVRERRLS